MLRERHLHQRRQAWVGTDDGRDAGHEREHLDGNVGSLTSCLVSQLEHVGEVSTIAAVCHVDIRGRSRSKQSLELQSQVWQRSHTTQRVSHRGEIRGGGPG